MTWSSAVVVLYGSVTFVPQVNVVVSVALATTVIAYSFYLTSFGAGLIGAAVDLGCYGFW